MFQNQNDQNVPDWKKKTYLIGSFVGAGLGFVSAYLFARAAEENEQEGAPSISTGALIGLLLSALTLIRQIAESGKAKKK